MSQVTAFSIQPICPSCGCYMDTGKADDPAVRMAMCMQQECAQRGERFVFVLPTVVLLRVAAPQ